MLILLTIYYIIQVLLFIIIIYTLIIYFIDNYNNDLSNYVTNNRGWKQLMHSAVTKNTGTPSDISSGEVGNAWCFVSSNNILKTCKEILFPPLVNNRSQQIHLINYTGSTVVYGISTYCVQAGYNLCYAIYWDTVNGNIDVHAKCNTWGMSTIQFELKANSIYYR